MSAIHHSSPEISQHARIAPSTPTRRRILFVSHVSVLGGAERTLLDLLATLDKEKFEIQIVLPGHGELSEQLEGEQIDVRYCKELGRLKRSTHLRSLVGQARKLMRGARTLRNLIRESRPHLVHANSTTAALYLLCWPVRLPAPVLWHLRDLTRTDLVERWVGRKASRIIVPSRACEKLAARVAPVSKLVLIPNGIRIDRPSTRPTSLRHELAMNQNDPLAVMVGQLVAWKGADLMLEAASVVHRHNPSVRFALIGCDLFSDQQGAENRLADEIAQAKLQGVFHLLGPRDDVREIMAEADLLVHPAFPEPFGRVIVEAMSEALPVVAFSGDHGPAEIVRDGIDGRLVASRTPQALARAICELVDDPRLRTQMGSAGRVRAREQYDRRRMAHRVEALYEDILQTTGTSKP